MPDSLPYILKQPTDFKVPLMISVPHCGTQLTPDFEDQVASPDILETPDTDWYVHELYGFAEALGIPMIHAVYSRYMIDLNRPLPGEGQLYQNANRVTGLIPLTTFDQKPIYQENHVPDQSEIERRIQQYYQPYYTAIASTLAALQKRFPIVMLYDGHSIRSHVPMIQAEPFVEYMPANRSGSTCPNVFMERVQTILYKHSHSCSVNFPFQGGNITRHFHSKSQKIFTFQMEISQRIYMDEHSGEKPQERWTATTTVLQEIIESFVELLLKFNQEVA